MRKIKENFGETIKPTLVKYNVLVSPLPVCGIEIKAETETNGLGIHPTPLLTD